MLNPPSSGSGLKMTLNIMFSSLPSVFTQIFNSIII